MVRVAEERKRHKEALERARKDQLTNMLNDSLLAKQKKFEALQKASEMRELAEQEKLQQADNIREQKA